MARHAALAALEKKATDVRILDLTKLDSITDYFVVCTGQVNQQVKAIADHVERSAREKLQEKAAHREGFGALNWVLLDFIDVVVHVFRPAHREFYRLEDLWSDADVIEVTEDELKPIARSPRPLKKAASKGTKKAVKKGAKKAVKKSAKSVGTSVGRTKPKKSAPVKKSAPAKRSASVKKVAPVKKKAAPVKKKAKGA